MLERIIDWLLQVIANTLEVKINNSCSFRKILPTSFLN